MFCVCESCALEQARTLASSQGIVVIRNSCCCGHAPLCEDSREQYVQELWRKVMAMKDSLGDEGMRSVINAVAAEIGQWMAIKQQVRDEEVGNLKMVGS